MEGGARIRLSTSATTMRSCEAFTSPAIFWVAVEKNDEAAPVFGMSDAATDADAVTDPVPNAQARAIFGEHQKEIARRSGLVGSDTLNPTSFPRSKESGADFPFCIPGQEWVLFSASHVRMAPVCEDPRKPAVRFYGLFESAEEASDHARLVAQIDPSVNLQLSRAHEWVSVCSTPERLGDDAAVRRHVASLLSAYAADRQTAIKEFNTNVALKKGGSGSGGQQSPAAAREEANRLAGAVCGAGERPAVGLRRATRLPRTAEVRDQTVVVASFVADSLQAVPEPLFRVYAAFGTQADADVYVRNTCGEHVNDVDVFVVSACEWLHVQDIDSAKLANEVYRSEELNSVMANHKAQPQKIEQFTKWRDAEGVEGVATEASNAQLCTTAAEINE